MYIIITYLAGGAAAEVVPADDDGVLRLELAGLHCFGVIFLWLLRMGQSYVSLLMCLCVLVLFEQRPASQGFRAGHDWIRIRTIMYTNITHIIIYITNLP